MERSESLSSLEKLILEFARYAHGDQRRKYTNERYINHLINVAHLVRENGGSSLMICAALLHDVVEDTFIDETKLRLLLGATALTE